ncbi:MAG: ABC transporter permease, partial [Streptomyces sp.]|nr:ABC transporter permease [Streptomyces sp.]
VLTPSSTGLGLGVTPIGPTWDPAHYFLGADNQGRDVLARLLYGGRTSLFIGFTAALLTCVVGTAVGVVAGYAGGLVDTVISRVLDVVWAFPVYLLAICLSVVLLTNGLKLGPVTVDAGSLWLPVTIIAAIYVPYIARPLRGQVLVPTAIVFVPLMTALAMLTESALSFLSVGVQPPDASWGTIIEDGLGLLYTRPAVTIAPGLLIALTTAALNILGDGVRDALDPSARLRGGV